MNKLIKLGLATTILGTSVFSVGNYESEASIKKVKVNPLSKSFIKSYANHSSVSYAGIKPGMTLAQVEKKLGKDKKVLNYFLRKPIFEYGDVGVYYNNDQSEPATSKSKVWFVSVIVRDTSKSKFIKAWGKPNYVYISQGQDFNKYYYDLNKKDKYIEVVNYRGNEIYFIEKTTKHNFNRYDKKFVKKYK